MALAKAARRQQSTVKQVAQGATSRRTVAHAHATAYAGADEHASFLRDVVGAEPPQALSPLLRMLQAQGMALCAPTDAPRLQVHPLLVPLAQSKCGSVTTGLLVPARAGYGVHVANARAEHAGALELVALSPAQMSAGLLAQEDADSNGAGGTLHEACGYEDAKELHTLGSVKPDRIKAHLVRQVGGLPKTVETLARDHLNAGNDTSALVTADWYKRADHFPGWAQPLRFTSLLMAELGRYEEARDASRAALACAPWWTLGARFDQAAEDARMMQGERRMNAKEIKDLLSGAAFTAEGMPQGVGHAAGGEEDPIEKAHDNANFAFDAVIAGESNFKQAAQDAVHSLRSAGALRAAHLAEHYANQEA